MISRQFRAPYANAIGYKLQFISPVVDHSPTYANICGRVDNLEALLYIDIG